MREERLTGCRHCGHTPANRPRGLCYACYHYTPEVRRLYEVSDRFPGRGHGTEPAGRRSLPTPTDAPPGTREKVAVLAGRAERGEHLFHPADAVDWGAAAVGLFTLLVADGDLGPRSPVRACRLAGCDRAAHARGLCQRHYAARRRLGRGV